MVLELRDKLQGLMAAGAPAAGLAGGTALAGVEQDVLSALVNLGCSRPAAETAVRQAKAAGVAAEFEPLFRRALELLR
jgi:Holliday junction DNA helicase RuvA